MNDFLIAEVSRYEIKAAVMGFHPSKCPSPDGLTAAFYQKNLGFGRR